METMERRAHNCEIVPVEKELVLKEQQRRKAEPFQQKYCMCEGNDLLYCTF
jgi:hypothetical protein